jgi:tetratricopeptide (TPR) repeat protein
MYKIIILTITLLLLSCNSKEGQQKHNSHEKLADNPELIAIYNSDQSDRKAEVIDWAMVAKNDKVRRAKVNALLSANKVRTALDYHHAALIFQHGTNFLSYRKAIELMKKSIELDPRANKWLLAGAIDRYRLSTFRSQIFGTNYKKNKDGRWELPNYDSTVMTDAERIAHGVETLAQQRETLKLLNKKQLTELFKLGKSVDEIIQFIKKEDISNSAYDLTAGAITDLGHQLLNQNRNEEALAIFKLNTELYPNEFKTFNIYGKCLHAMGYKQAAIVALKKSLVLNPKNEYAKKIISELE